MKLDYRDESQRKQLMNQLRSFKPFSKFSESECIPMDMVEKYINKIFDKYRCGIGYVFRANARARNNEPMVWSTSIKDKVGGVYLYTVHSLTLYEAFVKLAVRLHYAAKNGEILERDATDRR